MPERTAKNLKGIGQNRAANTIRLRKKYTEFKINQGTEGKTAIPFPDWVKKNFPNVKILGG